MRWFLSVGLVFIIFKKKTESKTARKLERELKKVQEDFEELKREHSALEKEKSDAVSKLDAQRTEQG